MSNTESSSSAVDLGGFTFYSAARHGCAHLVRVQQPASTQEFCGKLIPTDKLPEFLQQEGSVHKVLRTHPHPNILQPVAVVTGADVQGVVFPPVGEDLHSYVRARKSLPEREAKAIFRSILSAVVHCHKHRVVLRDLRLGKIFFKHGSSTEIVIGDLDGAQVVSRASPFLSDRKGSPAFVSPEVLISQAFDGAAADMWALGVILYILLTGTYPFQDTQLATLFHKIQQGHAAVHFPSTMSEAARDIIRGLLVKEPHLRLTAAEVQADLWLEDLPPPSAAALGDWALDGMLALGGEGGATQHGDASQARIRRRRSSSDYTIASKRIRSEFEGLGEVDVH